MLGIIKKLFSKNPSIPEGMPKVVKDYWYCGEWYLYREKEKKEGREYRSAHTPWPVEGKVVFNHHRCLFDKDREDVLVDGLIPAIKIGDKVGLYEKTGGKSPGFWHDSLPWDDGVRIELTLRKVIDESELSPQETRWTEGEPFVCECGEEKHISYGCDNMYCRSCRNAWMSDGVDQFEWQDRGRPPHPSRLK